jgi:WD40 repeat protein
MRLALAALAALAVISPVLAGDAELVREWGEGNWQSRSVSGIQVAPRGDRLLTITWGLGGLRWSEDEGVADIPTRTAALSRDAILAVSTDCRAAISYEYGTSGFFVAVWDLDAMQQTQGFLSNKRPRRAAFDAARAHVALATDKSVGLWGPEWWSNKPGWSIPVGSRVEGLFFVPGDLVLVAEHEGTVALRDVKTGAVVRHLEPAGGVVTGAELIPGSCRAVIARSRRLETWELETGTLLAQTAEVLGDPAPFTVSPDGKNVLTTRFDDSLVLLDLASGRASKTLTGHWDSVTAVAFTPGGKRAVSSAKDSTVRTWDLATGRQIQGKPGHWGAVGAIAVSPDGTRALTGGDDRAVKVWDTSDGSEVASLGGHLAPVRAVAFSRDGRLALSGSQDGAVLLHEVASWTLVGTFEAKKGLGSVGFSSDGRRVLIAGTDQVATFELSTGRCLESIEVQPRALDTTIAGDRTGLVTDSGLAWSLRVLNDRTGIAIAASRSPSWLVAVAGSVERALTARGRGLKVWDLDTLRLLKELEGHDDAITAVAISADGKLGLSASHDGTARVWLLDGGWAISRVPVEDGSAVAFFPDGRSFLVGTRRGTIRHYRLPAR